MLIPAFCKNHLELYILVVTVDAMELLQRYDEVGFETAKNFPQKASHLTSTVVFDKDIGTLSSVIERNLYCQPTQ